MRPRQTSNEVRAVIRVSIFLVGVSASVLRVRQVDCVGEGKETFGECNGKEAKREQCQQAV